MKFYRSLIKENTPLIFDETFDFSSFDLKKDYPLLSIEEASGKGEVYRHGSGIAVYLRAKAKVTLSDARTCKPISRTLAFEDEFDLVENPEDEEAEGYFFPENEIDLTEVYFCSLKSHIPYNATDAKSLPQSEGVRIYSEEEAASLSSPFDVLEGYDTEGK